MSAVQPLIVSGADISSWVGRLWWPSLRIGGFIATAPLASESTIPTRVKIVLTLALVVMLAPLAPSPAGLSIFSGAGLSTAVQEMLVGVGIGMVMTLALDALVFAGQSISMAMGLGFATVVDPQHGASVTVVGQLFMILGVLAYLSIDGHLVLIGALANSFQTLPIGGEHVDRQFLMTLAVWGGRIFETGLLLALPAVIALVIVNMALGVVTRAAPQLNLFGIGFTITVLGGFFVLLVGIDGLMSGIGSLLDGALRQVVDLVAAPAAGAH